MLLICGCAGAGQSNQKERDFFTSGSRDADQRAEQRVARDQQLKGESASSDKPAEKKTLYERLGGEKGLAAITDDFVARAIADPRVNWERKNLPRGGFLGTGAKPQEWHPDEAKLTALKTHLAQFLAVATGGPAKYDGRDMREVHRGMRITNAEFDAAVGDLKATLDKLKIGVDEQKELLAIIESTRTQVAAER